MIKELKDINITNTTSYLEFYNYIQTIICKARDRHLKITFHNLSQYSIFSPIKLYIKNINDQNLLFFNINYELSIYFGLQNIDFLKDFSNKPIKFINGLDPYEFLLDFPYKDLKDDHAQFTRNLKEFEGGYIEFPFIPSKFQGIIFEFQGGRKISISYKVFIPDSMTPEFKSYYLNELENYKNNIFQPSILDIQRKYYNEIEIGRNLKQEIWNCPENNLDKNAKCTNSQIKYKVDEVNQCNVIIQNSFLLEYQNILQFFGEMMKKFSQNTFPIIVIEDYNLGGYVIYSSILQTVLNYKSPKKSYSQY